MRMSMLVGLAALMVATSAAAQDVTWDYAKGTDFSRLKTYAWTIGHPLLAAVRTAPEDAPVGPMQIEDYIHSRGLRPRDRAIDQTDVTRVMQRRFGKPEVLVE